MHPKDKDWKLFSYQYKRPENLLKDITLTDYQDFSGKFEPINKRFDKDKKFNQSLPIETESKIKFVICSIADGTSDKCDGNTQRFAVVLDTNIKTEKIAFNPWLVLLAIGGGAAALLAIIQLLEYLLKGTGAIRNILNKFGDSNRRELYLAMLNAFGQTTDLNTEAINIWRYTNESGADINNTYSLRKQIGKILDYVYETIGEDKHLSLIHI